MLHEPLHQQLIALGLRGAAQAVPRLALSDEQLEALSLVLEAETLERSGRAQAQRLKLAKLSLQAHPSDVDLRTPRGLSKATWQRLTSLHWLKAHQHLLLIGLNRYGQKLPCLCAGQSVHCSTKQCALPTYAKAARGTCLAACAGQAGPVAKKLKPYSAAHFG